MHRQLDIFTLSPSYLRGKKGWGNLCQLGCFHLITSVTVEGWNVSTLTFSPVALCSAVSLLYCWAEGWDGLHCEGGWEIQREGEVREGGQGGVCVYVGVCVGLSGECCCLLTWSSIRQPPTPPQPTHTHLHLLISPQPRPISAALCQAWNLHINFSSVAP